VNPRRTGVKGERAVLPTPNTALLRGVLTTADSGRIGDAAAAATPRALRCYERNRLLPPPPRTGLSARLAARVAPGLGVLGLDAEADLAMTSSCTRLA
jgi:hypothetical protein